MIPVGLLGATGRLGREVVAALAARDDLRLVAAVAGPRSAGRDVGELAGVGPLGVTIAPLGPGCFAGCRVVIDVSLPEGLAAALPHLDEAALVTGVTGLDAVVEGLLAARAAHAPVLVAPSFAPGIVLLRHLAATAAAALPDHDVEIVEVHHRHKRDAPSGTALSLGQAVTAARGADVPAVHGREGQVGPRPSGPVGYHAVRGGDVVGEHTLLFLGDGERVELRHAATARSVFAAGALRAAGWIAGRPPGRYRMEHVLGLVAPDPAGG